MNNKYIFMKCACSENCIKDIEDIFKNLDEFYLPCKDCSVIELKKATPIKRQLNLDELDSNYGRCSSCGKRSLDAVLSHVIKILINQGILKDSLASLRKLGIPLITPGVYLEETPMLSENTLVLILENIDDKTANIITTEVSEVKGVIKGNPKLTVGQLDSNSDVEEYELLAGCDIRVDIPNIPNINMAIYKEQSKIHIEFPRKHPGKINQVQQALEKYENPRIIDGMCGPGTLGIYALKSNASFVLFNDIYTEAVETTKFNLKINQIPNDKYAIYNEDLNNLVDVVEGEFDIGIIDAFPGINIDSFRENLEKICKEVIFV